MATMETRAPTLIVLVMLPIAAPPDMVGEATGISDLVGTGDLVGVDPPSRLRRLDKDTSDSPSE